MSKLFQSFLIFSLVFSNSISVLLTWEVGRLKTEIRELHQVVVPQNVKELLPSI